MSGTTGGSDVRHVVVVSDIHAGSSVAVCPPEVHLDDGGLYRFSKFQGVLWEWWNEFWNIWVPHVTRGEPFDVVVNGDIVDGQVKRSTTLISANHSIQARIARKLLEPIVKRANRFYVIRGTEAHVGTSAEDEEQIAQELGACGDEWAASRYDLWYELGPKLIHFAHHIGCTSSTAYETSALNRELVNSFVEAGQYGERHPDMIVRSHRHRHSFMGLPAECGDAVAMVTPGWQLHIPFSHRMGNSIKMPQVGGVCIINEGDDLWWRRRVWTPKRGHKLTGTSSSNRSARKAEVAKVG